MSKTEKEKREELLHAAISVVYEEHPDVTKKEITKLFRYVMNYCKIIHNGEIPFAIYKSIQPCSVFYIRNRINDFLDHYTDSYHRMKPAEIIRTIIGNAKYEEAVAVFSTGRKSSSSSSKMGSPRSFSGHLSDVDGGKRSKCSTKCRVKRRRTRSTRKYRQK
jgi:hypothetical protein